MRERITFTENDRIAVIAPHPDDECLGAAAPLLLAPDRTDIFVLTDGRCGNPAKSTDEEAKIRKKQFEAEMEAVQPHAWKWLGYEDTTLKKHPEAVDEIDFTPYTKIFLPWHKSRHPDHRAAAIMCCKAIHRQKVQAECFMYEIYAPFYLPTHCIDITDVLEEKRRLIRFHADQGGQEEITLSLNRFRGSQMPSDPKCRYAECYLKTDAHELAYNPDLIIKLYTLREDPSLEDSLKEKGIRIKRVMPADYLQVLKFIRDSFHPAWASEALAAMTNGACFVAVRDKKLLAFGCAGANAPDYAGPGGTIPEARGLGINRALVQKSFRYLKDQGFRYAVSGSVSPDEIRIVERVADVIVVEGSKGAYDDLIRR